MLFCLNKHYIKNFKNFLISQYLLTFKQLYFKKIINISISFADKTFFLASFLIYTFCINNNNKFIIKNKKYNIFLPIFSFFFTFNNLIYPFLLNLNYFKKISKKLISLEFLISNFFLCPLTFFFTKIFNNIKNKSINLRINFFLKKKKYKYIQFLLNFFQIPLFFKYLK